MGVPIYEQETTIRFSRDSKEACLWTSDTTMMTKLDKLCSEPSAYRCISVGKIGDDVVNKEYVFDKALISLRKNRKKSRELTEEERERLRSNLARAREARQ